jgi:hypothetical protein
LGPGRISIQRLPAAFHRNCQGRTTNNAIGHNQQQERGPNSFGGQEWLWSLVNIKFLNVDKYYAIGYGGKGSQCEVRNAPTWCRASELPVAGWRLWVCGLFFDI